jgi:hypothetical protein
MNLQNPNVYQQQTQQTQIRPVHNTMTYSNTNVSLNSGMIGRIHKTKPGCSSCGKKVY